MSRKFARGEGADGLFLKTLTECIGRLGAIDPAKAQALREAFHAELSKDKRVVENPKDAFRHEGAVLERLFSAKPVEIATPELALPKPDITVPSPDDATPTSLEDFTLDDFGITESDLVVEPPNPYIVEGGELQNCLKEWMLAKKHPFIRTVVINDGTKTPQPKKFLVVGTAVAHGQNGNSLNINCTTGSFKKIRECDETILVHHNGRPVTLNADAPNGTAFFVWLCHFTPGKVYRFWMNRQVDGTRKDDPRGTFRILIVDNTNGGDGWRKVAA